MKILVVIDMQNDFISGTLGTKEAQSIVDKAAKRIEEFDGGLILFTQDTHQNDYLSTHEGKKLPVTHCIKGTHGWQIHERIMEAWRNKKGTSQISEVPDNSFHKPVFGSVELVEYIKSRVAEITEIELLGVCTDICVISNAIMLKNTVPETKISVNAACCAGVTPQSHKEALNVMRMCHIDVV